MNLKEIKTVIKTHYFYDTNVEINIKTLRELVNEIEKLESKLKRYESLLIDDLK